MVAVSIDLTAVIENILRTLPNTTTLAVVIGDAPIEKFWVKEFLHAFRPFEGRVKSVFLNDLSFGEIQKRVAALPPASAIYFGDLVIDAQGVPYRQEEVLARLHAVANAPIFGQYDYQLGERHCGGASPLCPHPESEDRRGRRADPWRSVARRYQDPATETWGA